MGQPTDVSEDVQDAMLLLGEEVHAQLDGRRRAGDDAGEVRRAVGSPALEREMAVHAIIFAIRGPKDRERAQRRGARLRIAVSRDQGQERAGDARQGETMAQDGQLRR